MTIEATTQVQDSTQVTDLTPVTTDTDSTTSTTSDSAFSDYMKKALGGDSKTQVSEEELFAGLLQHGLEEVSPEAAQYYATENTRIQQAIRRGDGYINKEKAALEALKSTVAAGHVTQEQADVINGQAFDGAQLDDNLSELFDDRGGAGDPTIAVASMDEALSKVAAFRAQLDSGSLNTSTRSTDLGPTGHGSVGGSSGGDSVSGGSASDGPGNFLWKPVSESDGNLVILLPQALRGLVENVQIHSSLPPSDATKLAEGRFAGDDKNGNRPHFRFNKEGSEFGDNIHVVAYMNDGTTQTWDIGDGGARHD